jgi:hypothetical protein
MPRQGRRRPPRLGRRPASRDPKAKIIVVCEGKNTEPSYISSLVKDCGASSVIDLVLKGGAGVPLSVVRRTRELLQSSAGEFSAHDQAWAVFDRDIHPGFDQAINEAAAGNISVAFSNPCFELWIILHYRDQDAPAQRSELQRMLKRLMPKYDPNKSKLIDFATIRDAVEAAERRAEAMERRRSDERSPRGNPCSTVYKLTREIRRHRN